MCRQHRFNKGPAGMPGKKPAAGPVWLLLGVAAVMLAAMTRKAYGCSSVGRIRSQGPADGP